MSGHIVVRVSVARVSDESPSRQRDDDWAAVVSRRVSAYDNGVPVNSAYHRENTSFRAVRSQVFCVHVEYHGISWQVPERIYEQILQIAFY